MADKYPFISVVVPVYGVEDYIVDCLGSIASQDYPGKIECLVVDDRGPDDSMALAESFIQGYGGEIIFRILRHDRNRGLSSARNTGIENAAGEFILFVDSDDELFPNGIRALAGPLSTFRYDMVIGNIKATGTDTFANCLKLPEGPLVDKDAIMGAKSRNKWYPMAVNKLYKKQLLTDSSLRFIPGLIHEDELWSAETACLVDNMYVVAAPTYLYKVREGSITTKRQDDGKARAMNQIIGEFHSFLKGIGMSCYFEANNILQSLCHISTWELFKDDRESFDEQYMALRSILRDHVSFFRINGLHLKQQIRDFHYSLNMKCGAGFYRLYCKANDMIVRAKRKRQVTSADSSRT